MVRIELVILKEKAANTIADKARANQKLGPGNKPFYDGRKASPTHTDKELAKEANTLTRPASSANTASATALLCSTPKE